MKREDNRKFIEKTESLVQPQDVTAISFLGDFNKWLPKKSQQRIMEKGNRKIPYMGFIVDPYCLFLVYRIRNREKARTLLPPEYELAETGVFEGDAKFPMIIFCAFSARTSAFIGTRLEMYIIARNRKTGLLSWIISDYETNTNSHDPKKGFCGYTAEPAVFTTTPYGELLIDIKNPHIQKGFSLHANIENGVEKKLDESLWIEGNLSVDYGGELQDPSSRNFGLIFDPRLMEKAINLPLTELEIIKNDYMNDLIQWERPESAVVFPYSQHFIIKQNLLREELMKKEDLEKQTEEFLSRTSFKTMKGDDIKKPLFRGMIISSIVNAVIILFLLLKLFLK